MVTIPAEEYANLLRIQQSADYVYGIVLHVAESNETLVSAQQFARNLLDEWTK